MLAGEQASFKTVSCLDIQLSNYSFLVGVKMNKSGFIKMLKGYEKAAPEQDSTESITVYFRNGYWKIAVSKEALATVRKNMYKIIRKGDFNNVIKIDY